MQLAIENLIYFIVAILVLVPIHEFGHFYVARRCGVKVLRYSIGFGKVLWRRYDKQGTEYALAAIPLGGYVKMLDEREGEVAADERHRAFNQKTVWQRIAIVAAGPIANFILAILLFWGVLLQGESGLVPLVGKVEANSIAAHAGLEPGQRILSVDDQPTPTWSSVARALAERLGESGMIKFSVAYRDDSSGRSYQSQAEIKDWLRDTLDPDPIAGLGLTPYVPPVAAIVDSVAESSPAAAAGFKPGDTLVSVNGAPIASFDQFVGQVREHPAALLTVGLERDGQALTLSLIPEAVTENGRAIGRVGIGVKPTDFPPELIQQYEYSPLGAFNAAVHKTWETSGFVLLSVKKLILGEISTKNLSGAISIANVAGSSAREGLKSFVGILALLSVFLAVFNLLPIPVLDGGHLFYYLIEVIKGKPVSERVQMLGYQIGLVLIVSLSLLALYNDIARFG